MNPCSVLFIAVFLIIVLLVLKIPLWIVFTTISLITLLLNNQILYIDNTLYRLLKDPATWDLALIMFLIALFVSLYRKTGFIDKLGEELIMLIKKPRLVSIITPAVLGLLPVPGGALMSAPIVDSIGDRIGLSRERKLYVNVWFRHVIFIVYPMSTVLVLTTILTNQNLWSIINRQIPIALFMITIGYFIGFGRDTRIINETECIGELDNKSLIRVLTPLLSAIVISIILSPVLDNKPYLLLTRLSMITGILTGTILLMLFSKTSISKLISIACSREVVELVLIGLASMYLRIVYNTIDLKCIYNYVSALDPLIIITSIPILFSLIGGLPTSSVVLSIPIISSIINIDLEYASLIYISAFLGYLVSPLHLCYVYSAQYYRVPLIKGYKYLIPSAATTLLLTIIIYKLF